MEHGVGKTEYGARRTEESISLCSNALAKAGNSGAAHRAINNIHDYENLCGVRFRT